MTPHAFLNAGRFVLRVITTLSIASALGCRASHAQSSSASAKSPTYAAVGLSNTSIGFADVTVASAPATTAVQATNTDTIPTSTLEFSTTGPFSISASTCPAILQAHTKCLIILAFAPKTAGQQSGQLIVQGSTSKATVALSGLGVAVHHTLSITAPGTYVRDGDQMLLTGLLDGAPSVDLRWSVTDMSGGSGKVSSSGLYAAPALTPASGSVTIAASLKSDPSVTSAITLPIWAALPSIDSVVPAAIKPNTSTVTLHGQSLSNVTAVFMDGQPVGFQKLSDSELVVKAQIAPWKTGNVSFVAVTSGTQGGSSNAVNVPIAPRLASYDAAVRLAEQAGFGATPSRVAKIQSLGIPAWIDQQLANPNFAYLDPAVRFSPKQWYLNTQNDELSLRQRVALILQQQFVVSVKGNACFDPKYCGPIWEDMLERDAFGNARTLLQDVVLSTLMGAYLDNVSNMTYPGGPPPNQNMGRELMQVMTIGTVQLGQNGIPITNAAGQTLPTYTQGNVVAMAAALSGWTYQDTIFADLYGPSTSFTSVVPMQLVEGYHDQGAKNILPGITVPAAQGGANDLNATLDALFNHPNFGPFLCKRLIQGLVKSNPSPEYVARISAVFAANQRGVRGDLAAVTKAILLDPEARQGDDPNTQDPSAGHLAEPMLYLSAMMNAVNGIFNDEEVQGVDTQLGQGVYNAPSVFGYYSPQHQLTDGTPSPEAQLFNNVYVFDKMSVTYEILHNTLGGFYIDWSQSPFAGAASPGDLLDLINHLLYHGTLSDQNRKVLAAYLAEHASVPLNDSLPDLLFLAFTNTSYQVYR